MGVVVDGIYRKHKTDETANTVFSSLTTNNIDSIYDSDSKIINPTKRFSINFNYRGKFSEKDDFSLDVDYLRNDRDNRISNDYYRWETEDLSRPQLSFIQKTEDLVNSYSAKAEYKHKFNADHHLTGGVDFFYASSESDFFTVIL